MLDFKTKPIIAMLHLMGGTPEKVLDLAKRETDIYFANGVDAVLVENYFGTVNDCERVLEYLCQNMPDKLYGVNILGDYRLAFRLAKKYKADFVQIDSVCGHLPPEQDENYAGELIAAKKDMPFQVLGGLRFKYQPIRSGRTLEEDAELAKLRCEAIVTTGEGTGIDCPTDKLKEFRAVLSGFPLIVGAGVTAENVRDKLEYSDGAIIGSWFKAGHNAHGEVSAEYVTELTQAARRK